MINIKQDGSIVNISYSSLESAYSALMTEALDNAASSYGITLSDQQKSLVGASLQVLSGITAAIR